MAKSLYKSRFNDLVEKASANVANLDRPLLEKAFDQSMLWFGRAKKDVGQHARMHPIEVMGLTADLKMDGNSLVAALIHHAQQDGLASNEEVKELFGKDVAQLVDGVTRLSNLNFHAKKSEQIQSFRKMFLAMASDLRVIMIKLADRLHLLEVMGELYPIEDQQNIADETLNIYAPIAGRLGIQWIKNSLEDLAFSTAHPDEYSRVEEFVSRSEIERDNYIENVVDRLNRLMSGNDIHAHIYGRSKHFYSIFRKLQRKDLELEQLYDIIAFRIIVPDIEQCYRALGLVHATWRPIQGQFEDYIAMPKPNGYQSLHTNVIGPLGDRMEVQIRTYEMHNVAENGVAAHWHYKESGKSSKASGSEEGQIKWLRQIITLQQEMDDPNELIDSLKLDLFSDYIFVFTPDQDVIELPVGATPVDFAFAVHTEVGLHITGAKVNGKIVPIKHALRSGDEISILTSKDQHPRREWLDFVKTTKAKNKIRHAIREEEREASRELGRELLDREFKKAGYNLNKLDRAGKLDEAARRLKQKNAKELMISVGRGKTGFHEIMRIVEPERAEAERQEREAKEAAALQQMEENQESMRPAGGSGLRVGAMDDMMVRFGKCCNPIPGDRILGFVTRGRGVTIHRTTCSKLPENEPERLIDAYWDRDEVAEHPVSLRVVAADRPGVLKDISSVFSNNNVNILSVNAKTEDGIGTSLFKLRVKNIDMLDQVKLKLRRIKGVMRVERVSASRLP